MKLKITDEKLDELAEPFLKSTLHIKDPYCEQGYYHPMRKGYRHGFRAAEQMHQVTIDKLMEIIQMQNKYLKNAELEVNDLETWLYIDHKIASTQTTRLRKYINEVLEQTDKMMKELND